MESYKISATILVVFGCFYVGFSLGRLGSPKPEEGIDGGESETAKLTALGKRGGSGNPVTATFSKLARSGSLTPVDKLRANIRIAHTAEIEDIPGLIKVVAREGGMGKEIVIRILAERWVEAEPFGALDALIGRDPAALESVQEIVLAGAGKSDARRTWRMLQGIDEDGNVALRGKLNNSGARDTMMNFALGAIAKDQPALAIELLESFERPGAYRKTIGNVLNEVAQMSPELALDALERLPRGVDSQMDVVHTAFRALEGIDREAAFARLNEMSTGQRYSAAHGIVGRWADEDPVAAFEWAISLPGTIPNGDAVNEILLRYMKKDTSAAVALLEQIPNARLRASTGRWMFKNWVSQDSDAAIDWARTSTEGRLQLQVHEELLASHSRHLEFAEQLEIADRLPEESQAVEKFARRWGSEDPLAASNWVLGRDGYAGGMLRDIGNRWVESDLAGFEAFVAELEDATIQRSLQSMIDRAKLSEEENR